MEPRRSVRPIAAVFKGARAGVGGVVALSALAFPAPASASVKRYFLKHPKREHCRAHYVNRVQHARTWCVRLRPTVVVVASSPSEPLDLNSHTELVEGLLHAGTRSHEVARVPGLPLRFTITDTTTRHRLGSFSGFSFVTCAFGRVINAQNTTRTFAGEAAAPFPACAFAAPFTMPAADNYRLSVAFAGNSTFAPSSGGEV
jgi:hypothetical protein